MVGMMLNLPACMNEDRSEWAGVRQARWPGVELGLPARRTVEREGKSSRPRPFTAQVRSQVRSREV